MNSNLAYLLSDSGRLLRRMFDLRVRSLGLTSVQARLLLGMVKFPNENQAFYAERLEVEPITLTRIVDRLEKAGWVERLVDPTDRRARILYLTDKSLEIVEPLRDIVDAMVEDMTDGLDDTECETLSGLLERVSANLAAERCAKEPVDG